MQTFTVNRKPDAASVYFIGNREGLSLNFLKPTHGKERIYSYYLLRYTN